MTAAETVAAVSARVSLPGDLKARVSQLRQQLEEATLAYRRAAAQRDSGQAILLLRTRSTLMRQLLESQCELLLALRSQGNGPA